MPDNTDDDSVDDIWDYAPEMEVKPLSDSDVEDIPTPSILNRRYRCATAKARAELISLSSSSDDEAIPSQPEKPAQPVLTMEQLLPLPPPRPRRISEVQDRGAQVLERHRLAMERLLAAGKEQPIELSDSEPGSPSDEEPEAHPSPRDQCNKAPENAGSKLSLSCKSASFAVLTVRLLPDDPLRKLMLTYRNEAIRRGWLHQPAGNLFFRFDGNVIRDDDTPAGLDMEDQDVVDVNFT